MSFESEQWLEEKKNELINVMFLNEFGIEDFRHTTKVINFDDLQSQSLIKRFDCYRKALRVFFGNNEIRSLLDYYYSDKDKKPLINLLKQLLRYYGYRLHRISEYQGVIGGIKTYKSRYTIVKDNQNIEVVLVQTPTPPSPVLPPTPPPTPVPDSAPLAVPVPDLPQKIE
jgi:hypothetical protein